MRVCVAFLFGMCVVALLDFTELAKPVEMPRLCCNTTHPLNLRSSLSAVNEFNSALIDSGEKGADGGKSRGRSALVECPRL